MIIAEDEARLAYTYAWWLTGNDGKARSAVLAAVDRPEIPGADDQLRLEILLRRVRAAAIARPTMCPASELSLLHDGMGLTLDSAAGLALVDSREARTELAHGRLEALGDDVIVEIVEPERLGGLAVGNPADVAAARQNPKLEQLRKLILKGRDEMVVMSPVEPPAELLQIVAKRREEEQARQPELASGSSGLVAGPVLEGAGQPVEAPAAASAGPGDQARDGGDESSDDTTGAADRDGALGLVPTSDAEEVDLSGHVADNLRPVGASRGGATNLVWLAIGVAVIIAVIVLITSNGDDGFPDGQIDADDPTLEVPTDDQIGAIVGASPDEVAPSPSPPARPTAAATEAAPDGTEPRPTEPQPTEEAPAPPASPEAGPDTAGLVLRQTGVAIGLGSDPAGGNPTATPFDPVSIVVSYSGAVEGDALIANWTVDGVQFDVERVDLLPGERDSRFSQQVPLEGWPLGQHVLEFTIPGQPEVLGDVRFTIVGENEV